MVNKDVYILYSAIKMGFFDKIDNVSGSNIIIITAREVILSLASDSYA